MEEYKTEIKEKNKFKNKNFFTSSKYALRGLKEIFLSERNIRIQISIAIIVIILSIILKITKIEFMLIFVSIFFVIFSEIINTIVEKILDIYTKNYNEEVKKIKDMSAGAVIFSVFLSLVFGSIIFVPKIFALILKLF